jgi:hypothetical protein
VPTTLPHRRRGPSSRSAARLAFDVLFNGAMLASALFLAFIVLEREEQYALDQQDIANQTLLMRAADPTAATEVIPPLD